MWVTDSTPCALLKLDATAAIQQTVSLASSSCDVKYPTFDGNSLLVANPLVGMQVVRAADGALTATIPVSFGEPDKIVFDGARVLVIGRGSGQTIPASLTLLRAADFSTLQVESYPPFGAPFLFDGASDGINFWVTTGSGSSPVVARY